ncbi:MAG: LLM class oxidoreductase [Pseudomonadota bacterium]
MVSAESVAAPDRRGFRCINSAYQRAFVPGRMTLGLVVPIENYADSPVPTMLASRQRIELADRLGFAAAWLRDVPFNVPSFGDAGQTFDPFAYLGLLAATTEQIGLGIASLILPLRHPAHVAKAAATIDVLSDGRLLLGVASGDRPAEYPALAIDPLTRGQRFRESYEYIRRVAESYPAFSNDFGTVGQGIDMLPKPAAGRLPLLITGSSQQSIDWLAANGDGWMTYPRPAAVQADFIATLRGQRRSDSDVDKPVMEPLYIDLLGNAGAKPTPIHLGFRSGIGALRDYLLERQSIGVNHVALNLRFNQSDIERVMQQLAEQLLPLFATGNP